MANSSSKLPTDKKERELLYFEAFRKATHVPSGLVEQPQNHTGAPDILVRGDKVTGIEITEWFKDGIGVENGSLSAALMRRRQETVELVRKAVERFLPNIYLNVAFHFAGDNLRVDWRLLAERIFHWIVIPAQVLQVGEWRSYETFDESIVQNNVACIRVLRCDGPEGVLWSIPHSGWPEAPASLIQQAIDEKNALAEKYRTHCDELWLLIVAH